MHRKILLWILTAGFLIGLMQTRLIELEKSQAAQGTQIQSIEENGTTMQIPETLAWVEKVSIYGDFRFRYEYRDRDWKADSDSDRFRIRARVGLKARINEEFLFDVRFATSEFFEDDGDTVGGDYVSGNKSLGDYWASKNAWIDRAYVAYTPNWNEELKILAGKTYNPFYLVGKSDLIWDHDLN
ncbi:MAG: putative porin, partial [Planctomycetota bacterium]